jgi:secreted trypsin-like serine protease
MAVFRLAPVPLGSASSQLVRRKVMLKIAAPARQLLALAALAVCLPAAQASTSAYDAMVASGFTEEGIFPRIVIRDDIGLSGSASFGASPDFAGVASISGCTAVLISPTTVLSARHCGPSVGGTVNFGTNRTSPTFSSSIQSVQFPGGGSSGSPLLNGGDVAILRLTTAVPANVATPYALSDATTELVGVTVATVGFGRSGVGSTGTSGSNSLRRGGINVLDTYGAPVNTSTTFTGTNIFSTDFDNPTGTSNTLGWLGSDATATPFEATTAGGDSGGPLFFDNGGEWTLIGVLSGGTTSNSVYGDISWWTGVAPFRTQIEAAGGVFVAVVPEPGTYALMLLGLGLVCARLRRSAAAGQQPAG